MKIAIINGPNLNLLGQRQPEIYGSRSIDEFLEGLKKQFSDHHISAYQSNVEGELVHEIQQRAVDSEGIILNAAAYTHTSVALGDAVAAVNCPVVEVHISNLSSRELFRQHSYIAPHASGVITGIRTRRIPPGRRGAVGISLIPAIGP
ncbi:MAG: type II 3-dehydroquinate dehydratase [Owenweeksia sp.]|nr:type II 3-dehydroquinate dehydratase [Owenweeksia sp.]